MDKKKALYLGASLAVLLAVLYFFYPLLDGIVLGIVFAYVANPAKKRMEKRIGNRKASLLATLLIIAPIVVILLLGLLEGASQAIVLVQNLDGLIERFYEYLSALNPRLEEFFASGLSWATDATRSFLQSLPVLEYATGVVMLALNGFIAVFSCYYLLADGKRLSDALKQKLSERAFHMLEASSERISGVFVGSFYFSIFMALVSIPFLIYFDISFWAIASGLIFLAALIPVFAEWMIIVALSFYVLLIGGAIPFAAFLIIGIVFLYFLPEFFLRPVLVGGYSNTHPLLLFLAFIGGGLAFGISGFFLAPMAVCVATVLWEEW